MTAESPETFAPPQPTEEHRRLHDHAGMWNVSSRFFMDPSQPPVELEGKETIELLGQFWTTGVFEGERFGAPFQGPSTLGYDPAAGHYVATWIDTMSPTHFFFTGNFDASGRTLEMRARALDRTSQQLTNYRTTEEHVSPDERIFCMYMELPDGGEIQLFEHTYRRVE